MYFQPPDEESLYNKQIPHKKNNRKRKKKFARRNTLNGVTKNKRKQNKLSVTMSAWAESYTIAATWQLKHQLAYWKARAKALEFENSVLHDIIKKKNYVRSTSSSSSSSQSESDFEGDYEENVEQNTEENLEVSEEFIQFLQENAKFKEDARREREKLKAKAHIDGVDTIEALEAGPSESSENPEQKLEELYGDKWQKIAALEMSLQSQFISECDKEKPMYWPNIPFNFNFG